jgi:hypothetical protein
MNRARAVAQIEGMEKLYRSWGAFEMAVQCQRSADYVASGGALGENICTWFDRGIDRRPYFHERDHMVWVQLPNTMFFVMPKDVQLDLWVILTQTLKLTEDDLLNAAWVAHQRALKQTQQEESPE